MSNDAAAAAATSPSRSRVKDLAEAHEQAIDRANQQPVSPTLARKTLSGASSSKDSSKPAPHDAAADSKPKQAEDAEAVQQSAATAKAADAAQSPKAADRTLETVPEGKGAEGADGDGVAGDKQAAAAPADEGTAAKKEGGESTASGAKGDAAATADKPVEEETQPLARILEVLPSLGEREQQIVQANLERVATYPAEMPLSTSWTLHFSDTSGTKSASAAAVKDAYTEGICPVFTATTVPNLCGSLKAFKQAAGKVSRRSKAPEGESFGLTRPGMNLHFFRTGITPTWEDPFNEKGGRLTISPSAHLFDSIYERLILLLAGSALELSASELLHSEGGPNAADGKKRGNNATAAAAGNNNNGPVVEGMVNGVVASRRARGDRIEVWLGGKKRKEPAPGPWIDALKEVLSEELGLPEVRTGKYKKHF
ncbi:translation initiation factor eIF4e [Rhodotorula sp. JG-1b]|nr:translation initiation factor eIF4e [Rhodotorula sp. JG-1b]